MRIVVGIVIVFHMLVIPAFAVDYYVSTTGSDSNTGTSLGSCYRTIQKAAGMAQAGDNVYVRGGVYRETVTVANSGTASAPITFQPYRNESVTISGLDVLNGGWSTHSGSTYQNTVSCGVSQLFVNGKMMSEARSSNSGYVNPLARTYNTVDSASIVASPSTSTINSSSLGSPTNGTWNGAKMAVIDGRYSWVTNTTAVTSQTGNTLNFQWSRGTDVDHSPVAGNRFYLYNTLAAVDSSKEYYYDSAQSKLYFNSAVNPNAQTVEIRTRKDGFNLNTNSYIAVNGFQFKAANLNASGNNNTINNVQVLYATTFDEADADPGWGRTSGLLLNGSNNTVSNSEVAYSWGNGIKVYGNNNTVNNNLVHDVDWYGNDSSGVDIHDTSGSIVINNTVYNTGRSGMTGNNSNNAMVANNDISHFGVLTSDVGGFYTRGTNGGTTRISRNKIHDGEAPYMSVGVYLDNSSSNYTVDHNLVTNQESAGVMTYGVFCNKPSSNTNIDNNTVWGTTSNGIAAKTCTNVNISNNLTSKNVYGGNSRVTNISTTIDQFNNSRTGDYTLKSTSSAIDAGTAIPYITDDYVGSAPDVGAFESGAAAWTAGANFKTWTAGNQIAATLTSAAVVTRDNVITTDSSLTAGRTGSGDGTNTRSFLKFDLTGVAGRIQLATLRIYENSMPSLSTGGVSVYQVMSAWDSTSVSYDQAIALAGTAFYDPDNLAWYTDIDVTSIVQGWINDSAGNYGFSLRSDAEGTDSSAKSFSGMYAITAPQLIVTIPEPSTLIISVTGMIWLVAHAWRRRK